MRKQINQFIDKEIKQAKKGHPASIILKLNSLSDTTLVNKLYQASSAGVIVQLIIRGIYCSKKHVKKNESHPTAISIVDEYLEHARLLVFHNAGEKNVFISSADWMVRNLDHRIEAACPILNQHLKDELITMLNMQLRDNVKARILHANFQNNYVTSPSKKKSRSQHAIYHYLSRK